MERPLEPVLVSACLLGQRCRYDGAHNQDRVLEEELAARGMTPVPICPEEAGGLPTPRPAAWRTGPAAAVLAGRARVVDEHGADVTAQFVRGAEAALLAAQAAGATRAFLKERSPSCGVQQSHGGPPAGPSSAQAGPGVAAERLRQAGIHVEGVPGRRGGP